MRIDKIPFIIFLLNHIHILICFKGTCLRFINSTAIDIIFCILNLDNNSFIVSRCLFPFNIYLAIFVSYGSDAGYFYFSTY